MASAKKSPPPTPSPFWCRWQAARGLEGSHLTIPDADLGGKWAIITGGNNGIGREAAIRFASCGANIILGCREPPPHEKHPDVTASDCKAAAEAAGHNSSTIEWWHCDMCDLASVEAFARRWLATGHALDILANNAGMSRTASGKLTITTDGFEIVYQVNFLSHVLLTMTLLPSLARAEDPRVVCSTSCMHYLGRFLPRNDANRTAKPTSYSNNKLYFQTWLTELQSRLSANPNLEHISVQGVHPGFVNTGIWTAVKSAEERREGAKGPLGDAVYSFFASWFGIDAQQGSLAIVRAATAKECATEKRGGEGGGRYFNRIWPAVPMPQTLDPGCRQEMWDIVGEELGLKEKGLLEMLDAL